MNPGDIVFAHSNGAMGRAIRFGERLRWGEKPSHWNHVAIVASVNGEDIRIIQAEPRGVTDDKSIESVGEYVVLAPPIGAQADWILEFARGQVGSRYGWSSIVSVFFDIVTPNWFPSFRRPSTWICSALVAESLRFGGWLEAWGDIYTVTPAQLYGRLVE